LSTKELTYNNNIFSFHGRLGRLAYFLENCFINILGFKFIYYPAIVESFHQIQAEPSAHQLLEMLSTAPVYGPVIHALSAPMAKETLLFIVVRYLFLIPLRMIDIKRMRDIMGRELTLFQTAAVAIGFSIPYVDFISTICLSVIRPNKYAESEFEKVADVNLKQAQKENEEALNKRLFEEGKISRAEFLKNREKK
jgi:uncharacterized membrane protein YhaH (DUF805 family)